MVPQVSEVLLMLNYDFIKWIVIAFLMATPVSWFIMNKWLREFYLQNQPELVDLYAGRGTCPLNNLGYCQLAELEGGNEKSGRSIAL